MQVAVDCTGAAGARCRRALAVVTGLSRNACDAAAAAVARVRADIDTLRAAGLAPWKAFAVAVDAGSPLGAPASTAAAVGWVLSEIHAGPAIGAARLARAVPIDAGRGEPSVAAGTTPAVLEIGAGIDACRAGVGTDVAYDLPRRGAFAGALDAGGFGGARVPAVATVFWIGGHFDTTVRRVATAKGVLAALAEAIEAEVLRVRTVRVMGAFDADAPGAVAQRFGALARAVIRTLDAMPIGRASLESLVPTVGVCCAFDTTAQCCVAVQGAVGM